MRIVKWLIIGILVITTGILSFLLLYVQSSRPVYHGEVHTTKVASNVKVYFDDFGIPHIYAQTAKDAYFTLGYVHAQERLFQMEIISRIASGRLSEIFGEKLVETDKFFLTLGIDKNSDDILKTIDTTSVYYQQTIAYLNGINQYVDKGKTPVEFNVLGIKKHHYTIKDVLNV